jgi:hypothetical protein
MSRPLDSDGARECSCNQLQIVQTETPIGFCNQLQSVEALIEGLMGCARFSARRERLALAHSGLRVLVHDGRDDSEFIWVRKTLNHINETRAAQ